MEDIKQKIEEFIESNEEALHIEEISLDYLNDILQELDIEEDVPDSGKYTSRDGDRYSLTNSIVYKELTLTKEN